jgi:spore coat protein CotF
MNEYKADITLNEKDSLQDLLTQEKGMVKLYGMAITEGCSKGFRDTVLENLNDSIEDQKSVFFLMTECGYYQVESAQEEQKTQLKQNFCKVKNQLN